MNAPQKRKQRFNLSFSPINTDTYNNYTSDAFSPGGRKNPYVERPRPRTQCWQNLGTGTVVCSNTQSKGELPNEQVVYRNSQPPIHPFPPSFPPSSSTTCGSGIHSVANMPIDSPLNRILVREPVGPWELVGFITTNDPTDAQSRDRTMVLYSQTVDTRRDRYNYRVLDSNGVPIDVGEKVRWKSNGETLSVPGQSATYTINLYDKFK